MLSTVSTTFRPVPATVKKVLGSHTQEGHELLRLITLLMREQLRQEFYPDKDSLNWSEVALHINEHVVRSGKRKDQAAMSDDTLRAIADRINRSRSETTLEVIGLMTKNPLDDLKPFSFYSMMAIMRSDREAYPQFDALRKHLEDMFEKKTIMTGVEGIALVLRGLLDSVGKQQKGRPLSPKEFADHLNKLLSSDQFSKRDIEEAINPPKEGYQQPILLLITLESFGLAKNPQSGENYKSPNTLTQILAGKLDIYENTVNDKAANN